MARLSKHGRELLRVETERDITTSELITWERITRTYHADGKILEKRDVRFKPSAYDPKPGVYSYGWKIAGKIKADRTPQQAVENIVNRLREKGELAVWKIVHGGPAPVMISQARIMRAVESGEYVGFCKDCGHSQNGCEPDARNYKCEHCGAMSVYGAEEMLIAG